MILVGCTQSINYGDTISLGSSLLVVIAVAIIGGALGILAGMSEGIKSRFLGHFF